LSGGKKASLLKLQKEIKQQLRDRDPWFFPSTDGVAGYMGTARIMFVGQKPSGGGGLRR